MLAVKIAVAVFALYLLAMAIPYTMATVQSLSLKKTTLFRAVFFFPFGLLIFALVLPPGLIVGILKARKKHV